MLELRFDEQLNFDRALETVPTDEIDNAPPDTACPIFASCGACQLEGRPCRREA